VNRLRVKIINMRVIEITGGMLRAARSLTGLSQLEIAERARISRPSLTTWENSSNSVPSANARALGRVVSVLENEGVVFIAGGATLPSRPPLPPITAQSESRP
jgi:transcriptional regulator with XRE-family HTH domain